MHFLMGFWKKKFIWHNHLGSNSPITISHWFVSYIRQSMGWNKPLGLSRFDRLHEFLASIGFVTSKADTSLFLRFNKSSTVFVLVYVDDILITGSSANEIRSLVTQLTATFSLKDLRDLNYFLGIELLKNSSGLHLSQSKYISDLLQSTKS